MASYATIRPSQEKYCKMMGMIAATNTSPAWKDGAALAVSSGLLVEATRASLGGLTPGMHTQSTFGATLWGFAASPLSLAITASGGSAIGVDVLSPVAGGT